MSEAATEKQLKYMQELGIEVREGVTKRQAMGLIDDWWKTERARRAGRVPKPRAARVPWVRHGQRGQQWYGWRTEGENGPVMVRKAEEEMKKSLRERLMS